jgi:hypothetical protein
MAWWQWWRRPEGDEIAPAVPQAALPRAKTRVEDITPQRLTWYLWQAVGHHDAEAAARFVGMGASIWHEGDGPGFTRMAALHAAAHFDDVPCLRAMLEAGRIEKGDARLSEALWVAVQSGHMAATQTLLEHCAPISNDFIRRLLEKDADAYQRHAQRPVTDPYPSSRGADAPPAPKVSADMLCLLLDHGGSIDGVHEGALMRVAGQRFNAKLLQQMIEHGFELELRRRFLGPEGPGGGNLERDPAATDIRNYFRALDARSHAALAMAAFGDKASVRKMAP